MSLQYINTGSSANKGDGDTLRNAFRKINDNFRELYNASGLADISSQLITIQDNNAQAAVDLIAYSGVATIPADGQTNLFAFESTNYRGASIDIFGINQTTDSKDVGTAFSVNWNGSNTNILGFGITSIFPDGSTDNAQWDLTTVATVSTTTTVTVKAINISTSTEHTINWRAKVSLFRS
jgi:hypothetical protein